jgi:hypothetical protein
MRSHVVVLQGHRNSCQEKILTVSAEDTIVFVAHTPEPAVELRLSNSAVTLPVFAFVANDADPSSRLVVLSTALLVAPWQAVEWLIEVRTATAHHNDNGGNYRQDASAALWRPYATVKLVGARRAVVSTVLLLPAVALGLIGLLVVAIEPARLSWWVRVTDSTIAAAGLVALLGRIVFHRSISWWKWSLLSTLLLAVTAIAGFVVVSSRGTTVTVLVDSPHVRTMFGLRGVERYWLEPELANAMQTLRPEGMTLVALSEVNECEGIRPPLHPRARSVALVCVDRWARPDATELNDQNLPVNLQADSSRPERCVALRGPDCRPLDGAPMILSLPRQAPRP